MTKLERINNLLGPTNDLIKQLGPALTMKDEAFVAYSNKLRDLQNDTMGVVDVCNFTAALLACASANLTVIEGILPAAVHYQATGDMKGAAQIVREVIDTEIAHLERKMNKETEE